MIKSKKSLFGLASVVAIASMFATVCSAPADASAISRVDHLHITVVGEYPSVALSSKTTASGNELSFDYSYQHSDSINFYLASASSDDSEEIFVGSVNPSNELAGSASFKLDTSNLEAKDYVLTAKSSSELGYSEDSISFTVAPETARLASASVSASVLASLENSANAEIKATDNSATTTDRAVSGALIFGSLVALAFTAIKKLKSSEHQIREDQLEFVDTPKALA